jgi:hypothetical protein
VDPVDPVGPVGPVGPVNPLTTRYAHDSLEELFGVFGPFIPAEFFSKLSPISPPFNRRIKVKSLQILVKQQLSSFTK